MGGRHHEGATANEADVFSNLICYKSYNSELCFYTTGDMGRRRRFCHYSRCGRGENDYSVRCVHGIMLREVMLGLVQRTTRCVARCRPVFLCLCKGRRRLGGTGGFGTTGRRLRGGGGHVTTLSGLVRTTFRGGILNALESSLFRHVASGCRRRRERLVRTMTRLRRQLTGTRRSGVSLQTFLSVVHGYASLGRLAPRLIGQLVAGVRVFSDAGSRGNGGRIPVGMRFVNINVLRVPSARAVVTTGRRVHGGPPDTTWGEGAT